MCLFKKKKKVEPINSKYQLGETIRCRNHHRNNDLCIGYIYDIKKDENGNIIYDVQIGGECPAIIENVSEEKIMK